MDEVIIKGNKYISSKRASKISGYAKDYVGQLVRSGKLHAVKVGRSWFVDERGLQNMGRELNPEAIQEVYPRIKAYTSTAEVKFPSTWGEIKYYHDDSPLHPTISDGREVLVLQDENHFGVRVRRMQQQPLVQFAGSGGSIDGIRVSVRQVNENVHSSDTFALPSGTVGTPGIAHTLWRAVVAGILVAVVVLFVPIFG